MVCASVDPSPVLFIQEKYCDLDGVFSSAPGKTLTWEKAGMGKDVMKVKEVNEVKKVKRVEKLVRHFSADLRGLGFRL